MSSISISLKEKPFSIEKTQQFYKDLDEACQTFNSDAFIHLFQKYDWYDREDYQEVLSTIKERFRIWNSAPKGITIFDKGPYEAKCIFCNIGKQVSGYYWKFLMNELPAPYENTVFTAKMAFNFEYDNGQLVEFGICNAFTDPYKSDL